MSLSSHVAGPASKAKLGRLARYTEKNVDIPKFQLPEHPMLPRAAATIVRNELRLDGAPDLNLASFVTTEVDDECQQLMMENLNKNLPDQAQYPHTNEIQDRCINILANLFHAPNVCDSDSDSSTGAVGTATVGSSEAIQLAGLAMKWRWRARIAAKTGIKAHEVTHKPNLIFSGAVHVSVLKLCRYFDIEARIIPLEVSQTSLDIDKAIAQCDENTCGVLAILGTTLTGEFEDIARLNSALLKLQQSNGWNIPIHVDGASGAMVAPFTFPDLKWDFRLEQVRSINLSGHKYGLVLPGLGWVIWRSKADLPEDLVFHVNYLGIDEPTFGLNFSRSAANVVCQYYSFLRLGFDGYRSIAELSLENAKFVADSLRTMGDNLFRIHSVHDGPALPMIAFSFNPALELTFNEQTLVHWLRERSWIIPAYTLAANADKIMVMRIVVRETFTRDIASILLDDIRVVLIALAQHYGHGNLVESLQQSKQSGHTHKRSTMHERRVKALVNHDAGVLTEDETSNTHVRNQQPRPQHSDRAKVEELRSTTSASDQSTEPAGGAPTIHTIC